MGRRILYMILVSVLILMCYQSAFAEEAFLLEGEPIIGSDGIPIGYGLRWNLIDSVNEYTILRYGKDGTFKTFEINDISEARYADTSINFDVSYDYYITTDREIGKTTSNIVSAGVLNDETGDITAIAVDDYDYISIRFSVYEPYYITVEKKYGDVKENDTKPFYYDDNGNPEKTPYIIGSNTCFLPIRTILDELHDVGGGVSWDNETKTALLSFANNSITVEVVSDKEQILTFNNELKQEWKRLTRLKNNRVLFAVDIINLLADRKLISQNNDWKAFNLLYTY